MSVTKEDVIRFLADNNFSWRTGLMFLMEQRNQARKEAEICRATLENAYDVEFTDPLPWENEND